MTPEHIAREIFIAAPPARVWSVVTEAEHLGTWFGDAGATMDLRPGGAMTLTWREHGTYHGRVLHVVPPRLFVFRWLRAGGVGTPTPSNSTLVEFTLTAEGDGTRLRVRESGFRELDLPEEERTRYAEGNAEGWRAELDELIGYIGEESA